MATITVKVTNQEQLSTTVTAGALTKNTNLASQNPLIWYPFDLDNRNAIADRFHTSVTGATKTEDAWGIALKAYRFTSGSNIISTANDPELNFADAISLSCWMKCEELGSERFIISHGSWQQRYKLSITPEGRIRWTVKTSTGVADLDGSAPIKLNRYYHVTVLFTGFSMELYMDGILDTFKAFSGAIQTSTKPITIGRMDDVETQYALRGSVDEVKIWNVEIPGAQIEQLKNQWQTAIKPILNEPEIRIYPNPAEGEIFIGFADHIHVENVTLFASDGTELTGFQVKKQASGLRVEIPSGRSGIYILRMILKDGKVIARKIIIRQN